MKRIITGFVLLVIGFYVLSNGGLPLFVFLGIAGMLSMYEVFSIVKQSKWTLILNGLLFALFGWLIIVGEVSIYRNILLCLIPIFYAISGVDFTHQEIAFRNQRIILWFRFLIYVICGFSTVYLIRMMDQGVLIIVGLFLIIWCTDIFAYYGGKTFGSRQLSVISPKKTIEGTLIGCICSMIAITVLCVQMNLSYYFIAVAGIISLLSQLGDLYESLIKRTYQVKDSSNLLPGHGGILDRADSTLYIFPLAYLLVELFL